MERITANEVRVGDHIISHGMLLTVAAIRPVILPDVWPLPAQHPLLGNWRHVDVGPHQPSDQTTNPSKLKIADD